MKMYEFIKCQSCDGHGYHMFPASSSFDYYAERYKCDFCLGLGNVEVEIKLSPNDLLKEIL